MNLLNVLLMAPQEGGGGWSQMIMLLAIVVIFYFFMIRPQTQKSKKEKQFRESLQKGQKIVTIGGMHGKIVDVKESTVIIEVANDVKVEMEKSSIAIEVTQTPKK
ncbi:MAG: preprotein translocase subunit YajC [Bacteroidales bacterium]